MLAAADQCNKSEATRMPEPSAKPPFKGLVVVSSVNLGKNQTL
jgi:hypothetical protein